MIVVIDFETVDKHLKTLGSGWVHGIGFKVVGASILCKDIDKEAIWYDKVEDILEIVNKATVLVAHNASYDIGILHSLGVDITKFRIVDTVLLAKLNNSSLMSYSLDELSKRYLKKSKGKREMAEAVLTRGLIPAVRPKDGTWSDLHVTKGWNYSISNMDVMYEQAPEVVIDYANTDVNLTNELYDLLLDRVPDQWVQKSSKLLKILITQRAKGVRIDIDAVIKARDALKAKETALASDIYSQAGAEFNINSNKELPGILEGMGLELPRTAQGNPSVRKDWLELHAHPLCRSVVLFRKYQKARRDFCDTLIDMQEMLPEDKKGRIYPDLVPFGASTGRFSCRSPNIQQIPSRDEEIGPLIRSCFIPEEGEKWYSLDFSSQESRLQIHYASLFKFKGAKELVELYKKDPNFDLHTQVANMAGVERSEAKAINLGLSYGMGVAKLAASLNTSVEKAYELKDKYNTNAPYLSQLSAAAQAALKKRGAVKTLTGRLVHNDSPIMYQGRKISFEYKGINKLIQGSAADQMIEAMLQAYDNGIPFLFSVHDQICASLPSIEKAEQLKEIMETCIPLEVPMVVEIEEGNSWGDAEKDHGKSKTGGR